MPTLYFSTMKEAREAEAEVLSAARRDEAEVITEIEKAKPPLPERGKPYALYYEQVDGGEESGDCEDCKERVGAFMAVGVCDKISEETGKNLHCDDLGKKYEEGERNATEVIMKVLPHAKGENREYLDEIIKDSGIILPRVSDAVEEPGKKEEQRPKTETEETLTSVVAISAFFCSWNEVLDQSEFYKKYKGDCEDLFKRYEKGEMKASEFFWKVIPFVRRDTDEGKEKLAWFYDALKVVNAYEKGEDVSEAIQRLKRRRIIESS